MCAQCELDFPSKHYSADPLHQPILHRSRPDPLDPHSHDPNLNPPSDDPTFSLNLAGSMDVQVEVQSLQNLFRSKLTNCTIISTGHGTSGPFDFSGVSLIRLISVYIPKNSVWDLVEVVSGDGFGTRIFHEELLNRHPDKQIILADSVDSKSMTREQGLIRLIFPGEADDALRQVKCISRILLRREI